MAPNQHSIGVSVRVRPSASCTHNAEAVELLRGHAWVRNVVGGSDQPASYAALGSELVTRLRGGYSCTLIAYGQTGSGKTYTMFGPSGSLTESALVEAGDGVPAAWGVFPRVALELLRNSEGALHASAVEVYNNVAYDLLDGNRQLQLSAGRQSDVAAVFSGHAEGEGGAATGLNGKHPRACSCRLCFKAQEEAKSARAAKRGSPSPASSLPAAGRKKRAEKEVGSFATVGETLWPIAAPNDVAKLARHVEASRSAHSHKLNDRSSRSHCLLRLHVASGGGRGGGLLVQKQFLFVDLAGSERTQKSGVSGQRLAEATQINNSLTVLGRVIRGLGGGGGGGEHLPYRDSTLTMLLRSSFESDCKAGCFTCVVINVASEPEHAEETACSLQFGERMTAVRNVATLVAGTDVGQVQGGDQTLPCRHDDHLTSHRAAIFPTSIHPISTPFPPHNEMAWQLSLYRHLGAGARARGRLGRDAALQAAQPGGSRRGGRICGGRPEHGARIADGEHGEAPRCAAAL